jgi:toluene monooxygenase system ferredoxin subunit
MIGVPMTGWHATTHIDDLWEGDMTGVTIEGKEVLLINIDGDVCAYHNRCPHQAGRLDEGDFDGEKITCSRHMWEFDARCGKGINPTGERLTPFPVEIADDGTIMVDVGP